MFPSYRVLSSQTTTIAECQWLFNCYLLFGGVESPTQATEDSDFADIINRRYGGQMELYRYVCAKLFNTPVEKITGEFYLI